MPFTPEDKARQTIDRLLESSGWKVQDRRDANLAASHGVAVREFPMPGYGEADYLLFVDGKALGVVEAKRQGETLTHVERQTEKYSTGLPDYVQAPVKPLPFRYESTGIETRFTNGLEPDAASHNIFAFHKPGTLAEWINRETAKARLQQMPRHCGMPAYSFTLRKHFWVLLKTMYLADLTRPQDGTLCAFESFQLQFIPASPELALCVVKVLLLIC